MTVKMNLKKIMALAMLALVALPSLTTVMGQQTFTIDGYKYKDKNHDGVHDDGEPGVEGVTITLTGEDDEGSLVDREISTGEDGYFSFNDVKPGTYTVTETVPDGWVASTDTSYVIELSGEDVEKVFGNYEMETETDLKCSIEIASLYLEDIKGIVDNLSYEYGEDDEHKEVLDRVNDVLGYGTEEGAEDFLRTALEAYNSEEYNKAARSLAAARNLLGRVNGMLTSVYKAHKVARINRFMDQVRHRIVGLEDKIERLRGSSGAVGTDKAMAAMGHAWGNIPQMGEDPSYDEINRVMAGLETTVADITAALDELGEDTSTILKAMDRLEAKIRVLKASSEKLAKKGMDTSDADEELERVESHLNGIMISLVDGDTEDAENLLKEAGDIVSDASKNIRRIRNQNKFNGNKGSKPIKTNKIER